MSARDLLKVFVPAALFFLMMVLTYSVLDLFNPDGFEPFIVPLTFWIFMQRLTVHIMFEKSSKLQESMKMMGLGEFAYWFSYFISDGVVLGFALSFFLCIFILLSMLESEREMFTLPRSRTSLNVVQHQRSREAFILPRMANHHQATEESLSY